ncbi:MAG: exodeoxyribonuclease VII large subunit, partial [Muribaculaceae bacterium]|nr:exodeoxyribonuclease VII large subunit [Muribaculaceae bacterium]
RSPVIVDSRLMGAGSRLDSITQLMKVAVDGALKRSTARLDNLGGLIEVLSPVTTLRRGYSVTRVHGHAVTDATALKPGDQLETQLATGTITSIVNK